MGNCKPLRIFLVLLIIFYMPFALAGCYCNVDDDDDDDDGWQIVDDDDGGWEDDGTGDPVDSGDDYCDTMDICYDTGIDCMERAASSWALTNCWFGVESCVSLATGITDPVGDLFTEFIVCFLLLGIFWYPGCWDWDIDWGDWDLCPMNASCADNCLEYSIDCISDCRDFECERECYIANASCLKGCF